MGSVYCDPSICCYVIIPNIEQVTMEKIKRRTYLLLLREKQNHGWQIILRFDDREKINDVSFKELSF